MDYKKKISPNLPPAWTTTVTSVKGAFYQDLKPMLMLLRAMGTLPYYFKPNGEFAFKFLHPVTVYTVVLQVLITVAALMRQKSLVNKIGADGLDFRDKLIDYVALVTYLPSLLVPVTNWPETSKKLRYFNEWAHFQNEFTVLTGRALELNLGRRVKIAQAAYATYIVVNAIMFNWRFPDSNAWWMIMTMLFCSLFVVMLLVFWICCCWQLERAAFLLGEEMEQQMFVHGLQRGFRLSKFRVLWLRLSNLTRELGNSMAFTMGTHIVMHFSLLVLVTYYTLTSLARGEAQRVFHMMAILITNFGGLYLVCSSAQSATEQVGANFRDRLERLEFTFWIKHRSAEYEIQSFLKTVARHKPTISFSGFAEVNRGLQTSFVSSLVTYMVVLVQFNMGEEPGGEEELSETFSNCSDLKGQPCGSLAT